MTYLCSLAGSSAASAPNPQLDLYRHLRLRQDIASSRSGRISIQIWLRLTANGMVSRHNSSELSRIKLPTCCPYGGLYRDRLRPSEDDRPQVAIC